MLTTKEKDFEFQIEKNEMASHNNRKKHCTKLKHGTRTLAWVRHTCLPFGLFGVCSLKNQVIAHQNQELLQLNQTKDHLLHHQHDLRKPAIAFRNITQKVNYY
ncbi:MAG: hypothetical protein R2795_26000 [Saprospiraceae bacterium]